MGGGRGGRDVAGGGQGTIKLFCLNILKLMFPNDIDNIAYVSVLSTVLIKEAHAMIRNFALGRTEPARQDLAWTK